MHTTGDRKKDLPVRVYPEERRAEILRIVRKERRVDVDQLMRRFDVSGATIRADLRALEEQRMIRRTHGGALLEDHPAPERLLLSDPIYRDRMEANKQSKQAIGRAAARLLRDGDALIVDDGSTNLHVVRAIDPSLRGSVLSNGVDICFELVRFAFLTVYSTGGKLNKEDLSYFGSVAASVVGQFRASIAILGVSGVSIENGLSTPEEEKAELKRAMIAQAERIVIVADHTKLDRSSVISICPLDQVDTVVTDRLASPDFLQQLRDAGIKVIVAGDGGET